MPTKMVETKSSNSIEQVDPNPWPELADARLPANLLLLGFNHSEPDRRSRQRSDVLEGGYGTRGGIPVVGPDDRI